MRNRVLGALSLLAVIALLTGCGTAGPQASFTATPMYDYPPFEVAFDASASSSPYGSIVSYEWDFGDGDSDTGQEVEHTFEEKGIYVVTLTVRDSEGYTGIRSRSVEGLNRVPTAYFTYSPYMVGVGDDLRVDASDSEDEDGEIVEYIWDFGDGSVGEGVKATHVYESAGGSGIKMPITLTVIDDDNGVASITRYVQVVGCDSCSGAELP